MMKKKMDEIMHLSFFFCVLGKDVAAAIAAGNTFDTSLDADYDFATATVTRDDSRTSLQQRQQNVADASMARLNENMPVQFGEKYPNATPQQYLAYRTYVQGLYNEQSGQFTSPPMGFMQHQTQSS